MATNILLIILDSVRADFVSTVVSGNRTTPFLDSFSNQATAYKQAYSPSIWSLPSHASIFTGKECVAHGVNTNADILPADTTIWSELSGEGYTTGVFSSNPYLTYIETGLNKDFDVVKGEDDVPFPDAQMPGHAASEEGNNYINFAKSAFQNERPVKSMINGIAFLMEKQFGSTFSNDTSGEYIVDEFLDWVSGQSGPWAACVNLMDAHAPYEPNEEFNLWADEKLSTIQAEINNQTWEFTSGERKWWQLEALSALYQGAIRQLDAHIERVIENLRKLGHLSETLVVITSDHGEGFGESSNLKDGLRTAMHGYGVHNSLLHVPLVVSRPNNSQQKESTDLASPLQFPNVVRATIGLESSDATFTVPSGGLLVSAIERPSQLESAKEFHEGDLPFRGDAHAVFEQSDSGIRKYAAWNDNSTIIESISGNKQPEDREPDLAIERVNEAIDAAKSQKIQTSSRKRGLEEDAKEKLQDLGYL